MFNQIVRPVARRAFQQAGMQVRKDHHGHHSNFKYATMDEACVPGELGGWKENYDKRQKKFNAFLVAGVVSLGVTIYTILSKELIFFNYLPPPVLDVSDFYADDD